MSQNGNEKPKNQKKNDEFISSNTLSEELNEQKMAFFIKPVSEFVYITPRKKQKIPYTPSTPKKYNRIMKLDNSNIQGRNLTIIFESM